MVGEKQFGVYSDNYGGTCTFMRSHFMVGLSSKQTSNGHGEVSKVTNRDHSSYIRGFLTHLSRRRPYLFTSITAQGPSEGTKEKKMKPSHS